MKASLLAVTLLLSPLAFTYGAPAPTDFKGLVGSFTDIINILIPIIFALTFITIAWSVIKRWIMGEATQDDIDNGKKVALIGVIALTIMSAIWGILAVLRSSLFE